VATARTRSLERQVEQAGGRRRADSTRTDLERIFIDLRALLRGTDELDANRAHAVDIAVAITQDLERHKVEKDYG
jgi:hypothetical protein